MGRKGTTELAWGLSALPLAERDQEGPMRKYTAQKSFGFMRKH